MRDVSIRDVSTGAGSTGASRQRLAATFNSAAATYHRARPRYPAELFDHVDAVAGPLAGATALEIGPATGVATVELARRGANVTAVELGSDLAALARQNLAPWPHCLVIDGTFEDRSAAGDLDGFGADLVVAATAWHWLDPEVKYELAARHLRPGGHLAVWSAQHVFPPDADPFFFEIQAAYEHIDEATPADHVWPGPDSMLDLTPEFDSSGRFGAVTARTFVWVIDYTADTYLDLLDTFSGHIAMDAERRDYLNGEIRRLVADRGGVIRRHWGARLHLAQRM